MSEHLTLHAITPAILLTLMLIVNFAISRYFQRLERQSREIYQQAQIARYAKAIAEAKATQDRLVAEFVKFRRDQGMTPIQSSEGDEA